MTEKWEDIIKKQLENDTVKPNHYLWNSINNDLWTAKVSNSLNTATSPKAPPYLAKQLFQHPQVWIKSGLQLSKWSLWFSGAAVGLISIVTGIYIYNTNNLTSTASINNTYEESKPNAKPQSLPSTRIESGENHPTLGSEQSEIIDQPIAPVEFNNVAKSPIKKVTSRQFATEKLPQNLSPVNPLSNTPEWISPINQVKEKEIEIYASDHIPSKILSKEVLIWEILHSDLELPYISEKRLQKHANQPLQFFIGVQKNLSQQVIPRQKEKFDVLRFPPQRNWGIQAGIIVKDHWILESGFIQGSHGFDLQMNQTNYYETPVRINPMRRILRVYTEDMQKDFELNNVPFHAPGVSPRDTQNFFKIDFQETVNRKYHEIPISLGYLFRRGPWHLSMQLGGRFFIPYETQAQIKVTILNVEKTQFEHEITRTVSGKYFFQGMGQIKTGWLIHKNVDLYLNSLFLPNIYPDKTIPFKWGGLQAGINYCF